MDLQGIPILLALLNVAESSDVFCRDKSGKIVDWWVMYKLPDMNEHHSQLVKWGVGHLYMDASTRDWDLGRNSLNSSGHALARTLAQYYAYRNQSEYHYMLYNDDHPNGKKDSYRGHTKGLQIFSKDSGFWLIHSVPRFPPTDAYSYPQSGSVFGQSLLCVSFYTRQALADISLQLRLNQPSVFASQVPSWASRDYPVLAEVVAKKSVRKGPYNRTVVLTSAHGVSFTSFAKHKKWGKDLYADLVAPGLRSNLYVETWLNGPGDLASNCTIPYQVHNLLSVKPDGISFKNSKDHSKVAVSVSAGEGWVCVGDINRQQSQDDRGGGTLCLRDSNLWRAYRAAAERVECCPGGRRVEWAEGETRRTRSCAAPGIAAAAKKLGFGAALVALWNKVTGSF